VADAAVVGSALVSRVADKAKAGANNGVVEDVLGLVRQLAAGVRGARRG
jgi:tryptophan synthase alpha chain